MHFTIGAVLARSQTLAAPGRPAIPLRDYVPVAVIKLVLHPFWYCWSVPAQSSWVCRWTASH